ncbi:MAG: hypothetical protein M0Z27_00895 [Thermaerobacter sp.]|nr:hypothetical protein [Thermaerobacter sp.]
MSKDLEQLEIKRAEIFNSMAKVGDFRRGSIAVTFRRCGKPNCACANPKHPGHGPRYLLMTKVDGKSKARELHPGPELGKVQQELANHRQFNLLVRNLVEVNEEICDLRPIPPEEQDASSAAEALKKTSSKRSRRSSSGRPTP